MGYAKRIAALANIVPVAGQRVSSTLQSRVRTHAVRITVSQPFDITADAASLRNRGSLWGMFDEVGLFVDGEDRVLADPRSLRAWNEYAAISSLSAVRQSDLTAAAAPVTLRETLEIPLANPRIAKPEETAFLERDTRQDMQVFLKYNGLASRVVGGGTVTVGAPTVRVQQIYDPLRQELPLLRPYVRQIIQSVAAANSQLEISLRGSKYIGGILIQQDSDIGEVTDIINSIAIRGDDGRDIIPQPVNWADSVEQAQFGAGGNVNTLAYLGLNFLADGRLSGLVHPYAYANLRLIVDATPSVTAGATNSKIRVTLFEYDRDTELTAAELPFII